MDKEIKDKIEFFAMTNNCDSQGINCSDCEFFNPGNGTSCREAFLIKHLIDTGKLELGD